MNNLRKKSKAKTSKAFVAQNPLILRYHRLLEAFSKADDENSFYFDQIEGFLIFLDLNQSEENLQAAEKTLVAFSDRFFLIPPMSYYETKKFMEGFVNEKVYDIDIKEKLLDIIDNKGARENFLEFICDHLNEKEKWLHYYSERSRIKIVEWLRKYHVSFVFEEDLDIPRPIMEELKEHLFDETVRDELQKERESLKIKAKTYYSKEALNPKPKRGRPPKQQVKVELEPKFTGDFYIAVPPSLRSFLFTPEYKPGGLFFFTTAENEEQFLSHFLGAGKDKVDAKLEDLSQKLDALKSLSHRLRPPPSLTKEQNLSKSASVSQKEQEQSERLQFAHLLPGHLPRKRGRPPTKNLQKDSVPKKKLREPLQKKKDFI